MIHLEELTREGFLILDGAMGTMLQRKGLALGERPEILSVTQPELIRSIHREYIDSGAMVVYTNTFGANARKLEGTGCTVEEIVSAAVGNARAACRGKRAWVALDMGPLGELLEPSGSLTFEEAYELFREQVAAGAAAGADCIVIETMTDLYEVKAALLAAKENSSLPVLVTMTFEATGRTFTGCCPSSMALTLEGLGADAIGINCSLGPGEIYPIAEELSRWTRLPLVVKANAGLPRPDGSGYDVSPEEFAREMVRYGRLGVAILGGCCGTTPEYIRQICRALEGQRPARRSFEPVSAVCTPTRTVVVDGVRVIGERINPTGKKRFQQALLNEDLDYILSQGVAQVEAGADILDVNVGLPQIDEAAMMARVVRQLQGVVDAPLQIDSSNPEAVGAALRVYNGKAIVNSVNGERKVLDAVLPLVKKYGAAIVGLTLDEKGIPSTAEERLAIARRILEAALAQGIPREDVYIDCLTLTVSVQQKEAAETLKAVELVTKELGLKTVLGVSNVSFGLPNRELLNHSFLLLAMERGLSLPILNPNTAAMMDAVRAWRVLGNRDPGAQDYVAHYAGAPREKAAPAARAADAGHAISHGLREEAAAAVRQLLGSEDAMDIVNARLIPALDRVGQRFEKGELFLPQLLQAASAAQAAFDVVKEAILAKGQPPVSKGEIVVATVKGDIHDIGKNIVKVILENYGYRVIDLGRSVPPEAVVAAVKERRIKLVGLSALMTTTLPSMEETIRLLHRECPWCKVYGAGAVLTRDYAGKIGADYYAKDAKESVDIAKKIFEQEE